MFSYIIEIIVIGIMFSVIIEIIDKKITPKEIHTKTKNEDTKKFNNDMFTL